MRTKARKVDDGIAIEIPAATARRLDLREGDRLQIVGGDAGSIVLRKVGRRRPLKQVVAQIDPSAYRRRTSEFLRDKPRGREVW